jgi:WD40 repeat protein
LYDAATGRCVKKLSGRSDNLEGDRSTVAFSPDGRRVAIGGADGAVDLIETATGRIATRLAGHHDEVGGVAFTPAGRGVVTAGWDGTVRIWNADTGDLLVTMAVNRVGEWVAMTPEGFFDASEGGAALLHVVRGFRVSSIDQFFQALFRPDLVRQKLSGDPGGAVRRAAAQIDLELVLSSGPEPRITISPG